MPISKAELARQLKTSAQRVNTPINDGMPVLSSGKVDLPSRCAWITTNLTPRSKIYLAAKELEQTRGDIVQKPSPELPEDVSSAESFLEELLRGNFASKAEAERVKENCLAGLRALEMRQKAGELIDFENGKTVMFDRSRGYRDALMQWPMAVGPLIAADFDVSAEQMTEALSSHVRKLLKSVASC